jgi:serine/threonine protein phosphatase PrpC
MINNLFINESLKTDIGLKRTENQDYVTFFIPENPVDMRLSGRLYIVADGVGGANDGKLASSFAADKVRYLYYKLQTSIPEPEERLIMAIQQTNRAIFGYTEERGMKQMATTLVAAVIIGDQAIIANVGDSRAYLIRNRNAEQITVDHNAIGSLVSDGLMTEEEALQSKSKNQLLRCVGGDEDVSVDVFSIGQIFPGDKILLCTDGITRYADSKKISEITLYGTPNEITDRLIEFAKKSGGVDNIGVALIEVVDVSTKEYRAMDILETQRPKKLPKNPRLSTNGNRKKLYLLSSISISVLCLITGIIFVLFVIRSPENGTNNLPETESNLYVSQTELSYLLQYETMTSPITSNMYETNTPIPNITNTLSITNTLLVDQPIANTPIEADETSQNIIPGSGNNPLGDEENFCVYRMKEDDDNLNIIFQKFKFRTIYCSKDTPIEDYFYFKNCNIDKKICTGKTKLEFKLDCNYVISIDNTKWIIIPVTEESDCVKNGGLWVTEEYIVFFPLIIKLLTKFHQ